MTRHPAPACQRRRFAVARRRRLLGLAGSALAVAIAVGACASVAPPRFHGLTPAPAAPASAQTARTSAAGALAWEVLPVGVPPGVDQPQWVVRGVDGSLVVLEQERWIAPLGDEVRAAVTAQLVQSLGAPAAGAATAWRVRIDVQRFESAPGREARIDAVWSVTSDATPPIALRCRGEYVQAVAADGYLALAAGHQKNAAQLGGSIAAALAALGAGRPASCGA